MKALLVTMTLVAGMLTGCSTTESDALTEDQKLAIIKELEVVDAKTTEALNNKEADAAFSYFAADNFLRFIDNGRIMEDYNSTVSTFKESFSHLNTVNLVTSDSKITVLSPTTALQTYNLSEEVTTMGGDTMRIKGAITGVFQKIDDRWLMVHVHQSYFPVEN